MKKFIFILSMFSIIYSCSKTEINTPTPPVGIKLTSCDSIKQGLLKTTSDSVRLLSCLTITNCDSVRLGILKLNTQDSIRLSSCIKIIGCDSVRLGILKPNTQDSLRLSSCIRISGCDSVRLGILKPNKADTLRLLSCIKIGGCDSLRLGILKPNKQDTLRLLTCIMIGGCDSVRLGILKPNSKDTLRLLSCIIISGCDSIRLGLIKSAQDILRLDCNNPIILIGLQKWMKNNLNVDKYVNGDPIPQHTGTNEEWMSLKTGAWCYYNNDPANGAIFGKIYNWYAVNDKRGLAPKGFHIPSSTEWSILTNTLGGEIIAGGKMKSTGTTLWNSPNVDATNESRFMALPGGYRNDTNGEFSAIGYNSFWWSSTDIYIDRYLRTYARYRSVYFGNGEILNNYTNLYTGLYVRCIKD